MFAAEAPSQAEFVDALRGEMRSQGQASASAPAADGAASANQQPQGPSVTAAPSVCPACWGVLQALDGQAPGVGTSQGGSRRRPIEPAVSFAAGPQLCPAQRVPPALGTRRCPAPRP